MAPLRRAPSHVAGRAAAAVVGLPPIVVIFALLTLAGGAASGANRPPTPITYRPLVPLERTAGHVRYWVDVPPSYVARPAPAQLLVFLHGCGGSAKDAIDNWAYPGSGDRFISIAVDGASGRDDCFATGRRCRDCPLVLGALADVRRHLAIDARRIVIAGFSAGGDLAYRLMYDHPRLFAGLLAENTTPFRDTGTTPQRAISARTRRFPVVHLAHSGDLDDPLGPLRAPRSGYPGVRGEVARLLHLGFPIRLIVRPGPHFRPGAAGTRGSTVDDFRRDLLPHLKDPWRAPGATARAPAARPLTRPPGSPSAPPAPSPPTAPARTPPPAPVNPSTPPSAALPYTPDRPFEVCPAASSAPAATCVHSGTVDYWLTVPRGYDPSQPARLLIWMHGCGGTARGELEWVSPGSTGQPAQDWIALSLGGESGPGGCWATSGACGDCDAPLAALGDVANHFYIDRRQVFIGGFSSGGELAYRTIFFHSSPFAGVLAMNTAPFPAHGASEADSLAAASRRFPIAHLAHQDDTVYSLQSEVIPQLSDLRRAGFPTTLIQEPGGHCDTPQNGCAVERADLRRDLLPLIDTSGWLAPA